MQVGTYVDGRTLGYDEATGQFDVGGTPISTADLMAYDSAGQITWTSDETRTWAHTFFSGTPAPVAAATPVTGAAPVTPAKKKLPTWAIVAIVIAALGLLACCGVVALGLIVAADSDEGTGSSTTTTESVVPDEEPEEPSSSLSADEIEYAQSVAGITSEIADGLTELGRLLTEDPKGVFTDDDVKAEVYAQIAVIKSGYPAVKDLEPPARFEASHEDLLAAMKLFDESMDELFEGIEEVDAKKVTRASELMLQGSEKMQEATAELNAIDY